jgi:hypothetical protein
LQPRQDRSRPFRDQPGTNRVQALVVGGTTNRRGPASANPEQAGRKPKRGQREGSVYQRRDGVWVGRIMLGRKANGKPDRPKLTGSTRADVQRQLAELRLRAERGESVDASQGRQTVAAYLDGWLEAAGTTTRPQTLVGYRQIVRDHLAPGLGRHKLSALRPDAIQRLYATKLAGGLSPYTVRKIHIVLHRALEMAVRWRYIPRNHYFRPQDRALLAGRDDDVAVCSTLLAHPQTRVLLVHGPTGCGKSSFLRAGLIPAVEEGAGYLFFKTKGGDNVKPDEMDPPLLVDATDLVVHSLALTSASRRRMRVR